MLNKRFIGAVILLAGMGAAGCATTGARSTQADLDAMNAKLSALQSQLSEKESEIAKLENQMREESAARLQAENDRRMLSDKLDTAMAQMASAKKAPVAAPDSDLK